MALLGWVIGEACNPCKPQDPESCTVRFDAERFNATFLAKASSEEIHIQDRDSGLASELERQRDEDAARHRHEDFLARERCERERLDSERRRHEETLEWEREKREMEERQRLDEEAMQRQRIDEMVAFMEAEQREYERLAQVGSTTPNGELGLQDLQKWLADNKFRGVNAQNSHLLKWKFPLHDAVLQQDAAMVRLLLRYGADPGLKNSARQTPMELAVQTKACEDVLAVFRSHTQTKKGGA